MAMELKSNMSVLNTLNTLALEDAKRVAKKILGDVEFSKEVKNYYLFANKKWRVEGGILKVRKDLKETTFFPLGDCQEGKNCTKKFYLHYGDMFLWDAEDDPDPWRPGDAPWRAPGMSYRDFI